jgi:uncharacterized DUF497 family protein
MLTIKESVEFVWDKGNRDKNWIKHKVADRECEEVFFDENKKTFKDRLHLRGEERFRIVGRTKKRRLLFVVFTMRKGKVRIISARDINRKERRLYTAP